MITDAQRRKLVQEHKGWQVAFKKAKFSQEKYFGDTSYTIDRFVADHSDDIDSTIEIMKNKVRRPFQKRISNGLLEVWLGPPDDAESELILKISMAWLPALIACLRDSEP